MKQETTNEEMTIENSKQLSAWSLCLPACRISESVQQLMELALNTLFEAVGSSTYWYVSVHNHLTELLLLYSVDPNLWTPKYAATNIVFPLLIYLFIFVTTF